MEEAPIDETARAIEYRCPGCGGTLTEESQSLICDACGTRYPEKDGIPLLREDHDIFYGEFSPEEMDRLIDDAKQDLEGAVRAYLREKDAPRRLGEYMLGSGRAGWKFLLPIDEDSVALDLGCGWGTLAYSLARNCDRVVAVDSTVERMQLLKVRAGIESVENIDCVCAGEGTYLPFSPDVFDVVVLNGVLEWVPSGTNSNPRAVQREFLRKVRRVLKPSGTLFLGIENRYAWKTWFRNQDGHTGLRFVPWLPRRMADVYSRLWGKGSYRNYLYGREQYEELLEECGFDTAKFFVPLPGYHHPSSVVPLEAKEKLARQSRRTVVGGWDRAKQAVKGVLSANFPDAFCIFASKTDQNSLLHGLLDRVSTELEIPRPPISTYRINSEMGMVSVLCGGGEAETSLVVKLPLHDRGASDLRREIELLMSIDSGDHRLSPLSERCPSVLTSGRHRGQYFGALSWIRGESGATLKGSQKMQMTILKNAIDLCAEKDRISRRRGAANEEHIRALGERIKSLTDLDWHSEAVDNATKCILDHLDVEKHACAFGHGDYKLANLLFDSDTGAVAGILDWGGHQEIELIGYDAQFLLVDYQKQVEGSSFPEVLRAWIYGERDKSLYGLLERYFRQIDVSFSEDVSRALAAYQGLKRLEPLCEPYEAKRLDHRYVDNMFGIFY